MLRKDYLASRKFAGGRGKRRHAYITGARGRTKVRYGAVVPGFTQRSGYYQRFTKLQQAVGGEQKFKDLSINDSSIAAAMSKFNPMVIVQGDGESERIGRKVTIKSISLKGMLHLNSGAVATSTSETLIIKIVQDSQTNGAEFAATQLLENDAFQSHNNLANRSRFKVLKSLVYTLNATAGASVASPAVVFAEHRVYVDCYLKVNIPVEFDNSATTGAITTVRSNSIWITFQTNTGEITTSLLECRIRYTDY